MNEKEKNIILEAGRQDSLGNKKEAIRLYKKAEDSAIALSNLATIYYELGDYKKSEKFALKTLKKDANNAPSYINLGNIAYHKKDYQKALNFYLKAQNLRRNYFVAEINLANTYFETKDYEKAMEFASKAAALDSTSIIAHTILGNSAMEINKTDEAVEALEKAAQLDNNDAWINNSLSQAYQKKGDWNKALEHGWLAIEKSTNTDAHHINFGYLLYEAYAEVKDEKIINYAEFWLEKYPENSIAIHMGNAIKNGKEILRANDEYLKEIFDIFSTDFDEVLESLNYQAPKLIAETFFQTPKSKIKNQKLLDAGCGTGLLAEALIQNQKSKIPNLNGVDISQKMLEIAKSKKLYKKLYCEELTSFFRRQKNKYDIILSSDVFTYIGDLKELFSLMKIALKKDGRIIFSISENSQNNDGFFLDISGRFLHTEEYIKETLNTAGFNIEKIERKKLRTEGNKEVFGFIISAKI